MSLGVISRVSGMWRQLYRSEMGLKNVHKASQCSIIMVRDVVYL